MLLFDPVVYTRLLAQYNIDIWPFSVFLFFLATVSATLTIYRPVGSDRIVAGILAGLWLWIGIVFHLGYYSAINCAAWGFGIIFILQGGLWFWRGVVLNQLEFVYPNGLLGAFVTSFFLFSLFFPLLASVYFANSKVVVPFFGVSPDWVLVFTLTIFLTVEKNTSLHLKVFPVFWCIVTSITAFLIGIAENWIFPCAAIIILLVDIKRQ